jgi:plasmid maintenance system antidote protein VapI
MIKIAFGRCLLQEILDERNMTQTHLSIVTGIAKQQINDYVNNRRKMSLQTALLIAYVMKCNVTDLYEIQIYKGRH